ncbi:N-acetyltransferase [Mesorhizobium sp. M4A.F.Ca.ET.020.02.1.1]|uniref:DapH/DapD/GlmU-related protein n=1 Tax=Mesorhizobium sp. M4A.F.Ca.ET.020.02.1.1 TaxID=2496652 RepID=UPI000FD3E95F|nr:DapH/DapD/GlmU-related protein [Mesorhizobium sp. M4A.F.Ca.ET.020.02.1.1]RVD44203.1 N-acetyltransferase [Mesorhizobium sp. M4A.F.Ca.ET.020.02.1.1]
MIDPSAFIHEKAHLDAETVSLGAGTKIWQFASVIRGAVIGSNCVVAAAAQIDGARIGDDCRIEFGVSVPHGVLIGDRVFIGPGAIFCNDAWPNAGRDGIDHDAVAAGCTIRVEDDASIGAGAIILPGVVIGARAFVAAGAAVDRNVPANMVWRRNGYVGPYPKDYRSRRMRLIC